ncbi:TonB-dependent receptor [Vibrio sp. S4M6]|uniref:TonB-dependent receptor domain-containing protein n=1 Tax=Vibrio sinus TaxID=2946865 RepID=UPI002029D9EC|nr:TonB-dependent receptor [Vibrio sinus]MCL9783583.1 TonB-dependent receptor [Vibrio sinus]
MNKSNIAIAVASLVCAAPYAQAEAKQTPSSSQPTQADQTMVVMASPFEDQVSDLIAPVQIITKQEIDAIQAKSLTQVLQRLPGIQVSNQGGIGQNQSVFIRGRATKNILVLMNGVRIGSATTGQTNLAAIPLSGVQRIEVLQGPEAAVYGSDAVAGVINIITTSGVDGASSVSAGLGSYGLYDVSANTSATSEDNRAWLNLSATHQAERGYNVQPNSTNPQNADDDGFNTQYLTLDIGIKQTPYLTLKANGYYQRQHTAYDSSPGYADNTKNNLYALGLVGQYKKDKLTSTTTFSTNQDSGESYGQGSTPGTISTNRYAIAWRNLYKTNDNLSLLGGVEWYQDRVNNTSAQYTEDRRNNSAAYTGARFSKDKFASEVNVRFDDNSAYGNFTTYQLASGYWLTKVTRITGSYGTSFKAPTFNDLYWPDDGNGYVGNPNLVPEKTKGGELAVESKFSLLDLRLSAYQSSVENMITYNYSNGTGTMVNVGRARIRGYEIVGKFNLGPIYNQVSYDYLDTENETTGNELQQRAKNSAKWNASYLLENWRLELSYLYQGKRYNDSANTQVLDPYSLVDFATTYYVSDHLSVAGKIGNLFNTNYETEKGYATPGRNYYISTTYDF